MTKVGVAVLTLVALCAIAVWFWPRGASRDEAWELHMENGKAYAARVLEEVGAVPAVLSESSGLAVSRTQPGVLWSHNASGDGPNMYAIDQSGRLLATVSLIGALAHDWEDMAVGRCPDQAAIDCLYVADTGDNTLVREELTVYVAVEPRVASADATPRAVAARSFRYRYPDARHDAEALAVFPNGDVAVVSKGRTGTVDVFGFSSASIAEALATGVVLTAEHWVRTGIVPDEIIGRHVTGAAVSPDGMTLAIRTYNEVYFYGAVRGEGARSWRDLERPCFLGEAEPQGEAIDYLDADTLLLTSEQARGRAGTIHRLQC